MIHELLVLKLSKILPLKDLRNIAASKKSISELYEKIKKDIPKDIFLSAKNIIEECRNTNIKIIPLYDEKYSKKLKTISNPPVLLFAKGRLELLNKPSFSIVGSREADKKAQEWTETLVQDRIENTVIVSGGAKGIDISAHIGALNSGKDTICVLGSGLNQIYPYVNKSIIDDITVKGLVISEVPPSERVDRFKLLDRNRITSGLSDFILIVTSKEKGGTMKQYKIALTQKRKVLCPDLNLKLYPFEGITKILEEGKAKIINEKEELKINNLTENQSELYLYS